jgi:hypothetical protein
LVSDTQGSLRGFTPSVTLGFTLSPASQVLDPGITPSSAPQVLNPGFANMAIIASVCRTGGQKTGSQGFVPYIQQSAVSVPYFQTSLIMVYGA